LRQLRKSSPIAIALPYSYSGSHINSGSSPKESDCLLLGGKHAILIDKYLQLALQSGPGSPVLSKKAALPPIKLNHLLLFSLLLNFGIL
jgi:hypothetical protein